MTADKERGLLRECKQLLNDVCHADVRPVPRICNMIDRITATLAEKDDGKFVYQQMAEGGYTIAVFKDGKLLAADADVYQPPLPKGE